MLYPGSRAKVCDNSGVLVVKCINCYSKKYAQVGDLISVVIEKVLPNSKHSKGSISKAIVYQTKKKMKRGDGSSIKFDLNSVALISASGNPVGTRVFGPVIHELRAKGHTKLVSLSNSVF